MVSSKADKGKKKPSSGQQWLAVHDALKKMQEDKKRPKRKPKEKPKAYEGLLQRTIRQIKERNKRLKEY